MVVGKARSAYLLEQLGYSLCGIFGIWMGLGNFSGFDFEFACFVWASGCGGVCCAF